MMDPFLVKLQVAGADSYGLSKFFECDAFLSNGEDAFIQALHRSSRTDGTHAL